MPHRSRQVNQQYINDVLILFSSLVWCLKAWPATAAATGAAVAGAAVVATLEAAEVATVEAMCGNVPS